MHHALSVTDWEARGMSVDKKSQDLKNISRKARYETNEKTTRVDARLKLASHQSNVGISCRIQDVEKVKETLERSLRALRDEKIVLMETLDLTEYAQDDVRPLMNVLSECEALRQEKQSQEIVHDDAHIQIIQTQQLLEDIVIQLQHLCIEAQKHLQTTLAMENKLEDYVNKQEVTLQVDKFQLALTEHSPDISLKLNPLRQNQGTISEESWEENVLTVLMSVEDAMCQSHSLREQIKIELIHIKRNLQAKKDNVQFALRKCLHRQNQVINKLQWQQENLSKEFAALKTDTSKAECRRQALDFPMKLAQTRLENRNKRPELCYDIAQRTLASHVACVGSSEQELDSRLNHLRTTRKLLEEHLENVRNDLNIKRRAVDIDTQCLQIIDRFNETFPDNLLCKPDIYPRNFPIPILEK